MIPMQEDKTEEEVSARKPVIGIIYPPPEVRSILDTKDYTYAKRFIF